MIKKAKKRLPLNLEILRSLQRSEVHGGSAITKPGASCIVMCTGNCGTQVTCTVSGDVC